MGTPDSTMFLISKDKKVYLAYSENLDGQFDEMLDILETVAIMLVSESEKERPSSSDVFH